MLKRLKKILQLSKKPQELLDAIPDELLTRLPDEDERADFLGEGTKEEYEDLLKEDKGILEFYKIIR